MKVFWKLLSVLVVTAVVVGQLVMIRPVGAEPARQTATSTASVQATSEPVPATSTRPVLSLPKGSGQAVDSRFGAIESFWAAEEAAELNVGWERILFYWNQIQPTGSDDWNTLHVLEEWLDEANAQDRTVLGVLKNTPEWAADGEGGAAAVPKGLYLPVNDPDNLWAAYTRQTAEYYAPLGVHNWIIWNEPDIAADVYGYEFAGSMRDYYQLLKVAYKSIKAVDPEATIHLGGMTYWHDPGYLRKFLKIVLADPDAAENGYFFDVITLHIYFRPESIPQIVGNAFNAQAEAGIVPPKEVWVNETNARPSMDPEWPVEVVRFHIDLEQQAWYMVQATALSFASGASHVGVYKLVDVNISPGEESWGLIRPHDFSKRPAFYAYQNTIKYLSGFEFPVRRQQFDDYMIVNFKRPEGATRVLWARHETPVTVRIPAISEQAVLADYMGNETIIEPKDGYYIFDLAGTVCYEECLMGGPPLFLIEEGVEVERIPDAPAAIGIPTITPTPVESPTSTETATPTITPTPTTLPTAVPTDTPEPTATNTPELMAAFTPTATSFATEVAQVVDDGETAVTTDAVSQLETPDSMPAFWLMGAAGLLVFLLVSVFIWQKRSG
ncbi:MAG: hypothetical protein GWP17_03290 [Aquificales bacterium]|nr:hypothetical protein [Aquificales bacterium]